MTNQDRAQQIVDGFFIGSGGDSLEQPNLTKFDLVHAVKSALDEVTRQADTQNRELVEALQNMTGMFGEAVTRIQMGKAFGELHQAAVKSAKDALAKYAVTCTQCHVVNGIHEAGCCFEKKASEICWCASKTEAHQAVCPIHG
jgi:hypothetical protein